MQRRGWGVWDKTRYSEGIARPWSAVAQLPPWLGAKRLGVRLRSYRLGLARSAGFEATHLKESITNPQRPTALRAE